MMMIHRLLFVLQKCDLARYADGTAVGKELARMVKGHGFFSPSTRGLAWAPTSMQFSLGIGTEGPGDRTLGSDASCTPSHGHWISANEKLNGVLNEVK